MLDHILAIPINSIIPLILGILSYQLYGSWKVIKRLKNDLNVLAYIVGHPGHDMILQDMLDQNEIVDLEYEGWFIIREGVIMPRIHQIIRNGKFITMTDNCYFINGSRNQEISHNVFVSVGCFISNSVRTLSDFAIDGPISDKMNSRKMEESSQYVGEYIEQFKKDYPDKLPKEHMNK